MTSMQSMLVVDDAPENIDLLYDILRPYYSVKVAAGGEKALKIIFSDTPPDLILLDVMMPGVNGYEVCRQVKSHPQRMHIPIIFVTAMEAHEDEERGLDLGAADYITKPFSPSIVLARIKTHLTLYEQTRELRQQIEFSHHVNADLADIRQNLEVLVERRTASLEHSERRFRELMEQAPEAILVYDYAARRYVDANRKAEQLTGRTREQLRQLSPMDLLTPEQPDLMPPGDSSALYVAALLAGEEPVFERVVRRPDGSVTHCEVRLARLPSETGTLLRASYIDLSSRIAAQEKIHRLAYFDRLTGLPNQVFLQERLAELTAVGSGDRPFAVILMDLDDFKYVNDAFGHEVGDHLLCRVAERLDSIMKPLGIVIRRGGDEFVMVLTSMTAPQCVETVARRVLQAVQETIVIDALRLNVSTSIGISMFPEQGKDGLALIRNADMAMYDAKLRGKKCIRYFDGALADEWLARTTLEHDLRRALENEQFTMHYQPQLALRTGRVVGLEALIRWHHPQRGTVSPATFIPIAEASGLIIQIGRWVLRSVCTQMKAWQQAGMTDLVVAVNLSVTQFQDHDLPRFVGEVLSETGLAASSLEFEITESCAMLSPQQSIVAMQQLRDMGIRLSIDDFGTGHSSLAYLTRLPIDVLKIDQSFVHNIHTDEKDAALCDMMVNLGHRMGIGVIAEGVETAEQLAFLEDIGVDVVQGYFFCKPLPEAEVAAFIRRAGEPGDP